MLRKTLNFVILATCCFALCSACEEETQRDEASSSFLIGKCKGGKCPRGCKVEETTTVSDAFSTLACKNCD